MYKTLKKFIPIFIKKSIKTFFFNFKISILSFVYKEKYRKRLLKIILDHENVRGIIICPPSFIDWEKHLFQRHQQLALQFSRKGYLVFYCNHFSLQRGGFKKIQKGLYVCSPDTTNVLKEVPNPILYVFLGTNIKYISTYQYSKLVYDYIDDLEMVRRNKEILRSHHQLVKISDVVIATADNLYKEARKERKEVLLCPNAVDYQSFHQKSEKKSLPDIEIINSTGRPIIGHHGALAEWVDYDLIFFCAKSRPDYNFVFVGADYFDSIKKMNLKNLIYLGQKVYQDVPHYVSYFDIGIIPFKLNKITHAINPIKIFEYMASGKPIVATAIQECLKYKSILISKNQEEFLKNLDKALKLKHNTAYLKLLDKEVQENTWEKRVEQIIRSLKINHK